MKIKKIIILSFLALLTICSFGQSKFGYINSSELLSIMPEKKTAEGELQTLIKSLETQLIGMEGELQAKFTDYQNKESSYDELTKKDKETEIQDLQQRMQSFQQNSQNAIEKKQQELMGPIMAKANKAIEDVAKEGKFTYIFDSGMGSILYADENENVMSLVKKKLGL